MPQTCSIATIVTVILNIASPKNNRIWLLKKEYAIYTLASLPMFYAVETKLSHISTFILILKFWITVNCRMIKWRPHSLSLHSEIHRQCMYFTFSILCSDSPILHNKESLKFCLFLSARLSFCRAIIWIALCAGNQTFSCGPSNAALL